MFLSLPESMEFATRERDASAPKVKINFTTIAPDVAAEIFTYGVQVLLNRAANTPDAVHKAVAIAERLNSGQHWRTRGTGEAQDSLTVETRRLAESKVKAAKPKDTKMADWLSNPKVKAKISEIMARPETIAQAKEIMSLRKLPGDLDLDNL